MYLRGEQGYQALQLHVVTLSASGISRVAAFLDPALFRTFDLPDTLALR
jgi:hypothetical protein